MSYELKVWRDPYESGYNVTVPKKVVLEEGLTVLIGCNGAGKSTFLKNVEDQAKKEGIPTLFFDQNGEGHRSNSMQSAFYGNNYALAAQMWTASEGECISINVGRIASELREFLRSGETAKERERRRLDAAFNPERVRKTVTDKRRFLLLDAIDSGYSIDNVLELKDLIQVIMEDSKEMGVETYVIISANEYELASGERCLDVQRGKYLCMKTYPIYRKFILSSRKRKEERIKKSEEWLKKQEAKEAELERMENHGRKKKGWKVKDGT